MIFTTMTNRITIVFFLLLFWEGLQAQKSLLIDRQEYTCANSFSISVRTKNISNVVALQGSIVWDTSVIHYSGISFTASAISFNASNINTSGAGNGYLSFLWFDNNVQGRTVADSTALFTLQFTRNGTGNGTGYVNFSNDPTPLEMDTTDAAGLPVNNLAAVFTNGYVVTPSIYRFTGSGNWSLATNWQNNQLPPAVLPACSEIFINPQGSAVCSLDVPQAIAPGAKLTIADGKKLAVQGNISIQ